MIATTGFQSMTVSDAIRDDAELMRLVDRGSQVLAEILGESLPLVDVQWDSVQDGTGRRTLELTLRDATGEAAVRLEPAEFEDRTLLWLRLSSAWTKLLRAQSKVRFREMQEAVRRLDALDA